MPATNTKPADESQLREELAKLRRHVFEQDRAMLEMANTLDVLKRELLALRDRASGGGLPQFPADEKPPHY